MKRSETGFPLGFGPRSDAEVQARQDNAKKHSGDLDTRKLPEGEKKGLRDLDTSNLPGTGKRFDPDTDVWREFLTRLPLVHEEAHRIGMHRTGHALHEAVREAGYELAERLSIK